MRYVVFLVSILIFSCNDKPKSQPKDFNEEIVDLAIENSKNKYIELPNLYDSLPKKILNDKTEKLILVQILKQKGYKIIDWGRGNHSFGPRIVSMTLKKDNCECEVDKIYYSNNNLSDSIYSITERIKCKKN